MCRVARGYGQDLRTVKGKLFAEDVWTMARHLPKLQLEEAELLSAVITRDLVRDLWKAAVDMLEICGILKKKSEEVTREAFADKTEEELKAEAHKRANALIRSMTLKRPGK